ncbi:TetR/AcrR family transcriptional regulator [Dyadobacter sandarakinus]|uniref:TetR/AcrR family transcriptional regulator n=1 Tax=Dyadobacter sandarakinus TaxID=2747268 RepID=A0ABX7I513_9BACT|nr:TetR family transcriptional regulator [Dyadobacter sandarakinus]QRR00960.1 TetR/AcrR family transcriptional regulator [Dyadobacter sandarakinus]
MDNNPKKSQILEVAEKLFAERGFAGTSVRDIAHEADVNVSMISYYFGSKEKLIDALFESRTDESRSQLESLVMNEELAPLQKINIMIDAVVERLVEKECFHKIMMRVQLTSERSEVISEKVMGFKLRNMELMKKLVEEGQHAGVFRSGLDLSLMMTTLYGTVNQAIATQDFYRIIHNLEHMDHLEFRAHLKRKLSQHLKNLFKSTVTNEHHVEN